MTFQKHMRLIIIGPPGGGKGTLCEHIVKDYGVVHISGGDLLREEIAMGTPIGLEAKDLMEQGRLVPDEAMIRLILNRMQQKDCVARGVLLDGFPRTLSQAQALTRVGAAFDGVVVLNVSVDALLERALGRRLDPTTGRVYHLKFQPPPADIASRLVVRPDDTEERQRYRIGVYNKFRDQLVAHFVGSVVEVNGNQPIPKVYDEFRLKIAQRLLDKQRVAPTNPTSKL